MISDMFAFGFGALGLVLGLLGLAGGWKTFEKAGKPGLLVLIPILNLLNLIDIAGKPLWWALLLLIPGVNVIVTILVMIEVAKRFDRGALFGLGLFFLGPICWFLLGFGSSTYRPALRA